MKNKESWFPSKFVGQNASTKLRETQRRWGLGPALLPTYSAVFMKEPYGSMRMACYLIWGAEECLCTRFTVSEASWKAQKPLLAHLSSGLEGRPCSLLSCIYDSIIEAEVSRLFVARH